MKCAKLTNIFVCHLSVLSTLCIRVHDESMVMVFNELYVPPLRQVSLLVIANIVCRGMPVFNAMAIMTMVDRWRPETHSFHLSCSKMMVTLEDMAMILGLSIRGRPKTGRVYSTSWCERVAAFVGPEPPVKVPSVKG
jgi:hypothetical protein